MVKRKQNQNSTDEEKHLMTHYLPLRDHDRKFLSDMVRGQYLEGECYAFAIAMHHALGWPLMGLMEGSVIRHAAVKEDHGQYLEARGLFGRNAFGKPFGVPTKPIIQQITEAQLRAVKTTTIYPRSVETARHMAQALWPTLPWIQEKSLLHKTFAFAKELEALSKKHGIWIRSPYPTTCPILTSDTDEALHYVVQPLPTGDAYTIDRRYKEK